MDLVEEPVLDVLRRLGRSREIHHEQYGRPIPVGVEEISRDERIRRAGHGRGWLIEFFEPQRSP
ncbi:hypothetical protein BRD05_03070 [Halobacteriales archaeon QS_9_70_65]|nr:MAG: hypothetical protein BRD05_03070 [Halobacteriales archaeon QS_9_70_65]